MGEPAAPGPAEKELRSDQEHATPSVGAAVAGGASGGRRPGSVGAAGDAATKRIAAGGGAASADPDLPGDLSRPEQVLLFVGRLAATAASDLAAQIERLGTAGRLAFASHLPGTLDETERAIVRSVFDHTPDAEVATLEKLIGARFAIRVVGPEGDARGVDWDAAALRRSWRLLEALPAAHAGDDLTLSPTANRASAGSVAYTAGPMDEEDRGRSGAGEPLAHNLFLELARHEIGHAVAERLQLVERYCLGNAPGGDWRRYPDGDACGRAMVALGGAAAPPSENTLAVGDRRFVRGYDGGYASHAAGALERRLSPIQFRSPDEWIAEAWAAWQSPGPDGEARGAGLARVDPESAAWLDENVAPELEKGS